MYLIEHVLFPTNPPPITAIFMCKTGAPQKIIENWASNTVNLLNAIFEILEFLPLLPKKRVVSANLE